MTLHNHPKKLLEDIAYNREKVLNVLPQAQYALGLLEGSQKNLENPTLLISPLLTKEATVSSKIEGTQSTVMDVFAYSGEGDAVHSDTREVWNYREAMHFSMRYLKEKKISKSFIKQLHQLLLEGVRRNPGSVTGEFRLKDVWIGQEGCAIEEASYVPPEFFLLNDYMEDLIEYMSKSEDNSIIKSAIMHYQFEAVHPFDDGNGRIGRLLIPLIPLCDKQISSPILYVSGYCEKNKDEYIKALRSVDKTGDFTEWIIFFIKAVTIQLKETQVLIDSIYALFADIKKESASSNYRYDLDFIDFIFKKPIFTLSDITKEIGMSRITAKNLVNNFIEKKYLVETGFLKKRSKVYSFDKLINLLS